MTNRARNFSQGIKHDITQFTPLHDDSSWDSWNRTAQLHPHTMVMSKSQNNAAMKHILEVIFDKDDGSELHQALKLYSIDSPQSICSLEENEMYLLTYPDYDSNALEYLR